MMAEVSMEHCHDDVQSSYRPLEEAMGLKPARMGDLSPAYIVRRSTFWKFAMAVLLMSAGLILLYSTTKGTVRSVEEAWTQEIRAERRSEHDLGTKLASLELELEQELLRRSKEGVMATQFKDRVKQAERDHSRSVAERFVGLSADLKLSEAQYRAVLELFHDKINSYHGQARLLAQALASQFETRAKKAQSKLEDLKGLLHETFAREISAREKFLRSGHSDRRDKTGTGYHGEVEGQELQESMFQSPEEHAQYLEHQRTAKAMEQRLRTFFEQFSNFEGAWKEIQLKKDEKLWKDLRKLHLEVRDTLFMEDATKYYDRMAELEDRAVKFNEQLKTRDIVQFDPQRHSLFLYLRNILMDASFPEMRGMVKDWQKAWEENPSRTFEILSKVENEVYEGLIPEEFLFEDLEAFNKAHGIVGEMEGEGDELGETWRADQDVDLPVLSTEIERLNQEVEREAQERAAREREALQKMEEQIVQKKKHEQEALEKREREAIHNAMKKSQEILEDKAVSKTGVEDRDLAKAKRTDEEVGGDESSTRVKTESTAESNALSKLDTEEKVEHETDNSNGE